MNLVMPFSNVPGSSAVPTHGSLGKPNSFDQLAN